MVTLSDSPPWKAKEYFDKIDQFWKVTEVARLNLTTSEAG